MRRKTFIAGARVLAAIALLLALHVPSGSPRAAGDAPQGSPAKEKKSSTEKGSGNGGGKGSKDADGEAGSDKVLIWLRVGKTVEGGVEITIQLGQRLQDIAKAYDMTVEEIVKANPGLDASLVKAGEKIFIPGAASVKAIRTLVPSDKIGELEGMGGGPGDKDPSASPGKQGKGKDEEMVPIKSGKVTAKGVVHTVQEGQTLTLIAEAYGVGKGKIVKASGLGSADSIKPGQKILVPGAQKVVAVPGIKSAEGAGGGCKIKSGSVVKAGVLQTVMPGQTLWDISKAYDVKAEAILKANGLKSPSGIKVGKKVIVPGAAEVKEVHCSAKGLKNMIYTQPVTFHRIHTGETKPLNLFTPVGKLNKGDVKHFEQMMYDQRTNKTHKVHQRLESLVALVANHFGYKTLIIYSGYRAPSKFQFTKKSKHNVGRAIDFAVEGISNWKLMTYCRSFSNVGVGYYPNSYFVHLDVREAPAFWVDYSGPGQKPKYGKMKAGLKKKAKVGSVTPGGEADDEAESDAEDVEVTKKGTAG